MSSYVEMHFSNSNGIEVTGGLEGGMTGFAAIIVAAGKGTRTGLNRPKQWEFLLGKRVIDWSVDTFLAHPDLWELVIVVDDPALAASFPSTTKVVYGGDTRTASVRAGIAAFLTEDDIPVLIHDAARPGLSLSMIDTLLSALAEHDAAAPALAVTDALKTQAAGHLATVPRDDLVRVQTPQAFRLSVIRTALEAPGAFVDDLEAVEASGARVTLVPGDPKLHKITYPEDFDLVARLIAPALSIPRVGKGFDVHAFEPGDHVTLCGVKIPHTAKLQGRRMQISRHRAVVSLPPSERQSSFIQSRSRIRSYRNTGPSRQMNVGPNWQCPHSPTAHFMLRSMER